LKDFHGTDAAALLSIMDVAGVEEVGVLQTGFSLLLDDFPRST
jgi:hypothetical protein